MCASVRRGTLRRSVVNALYSWLTVQVKRNGQIYRQEFTRGEPTTPLVTVGSCGTESETSGGQASNR
jgi:DNA gyrase/topoisomerase IV subunit B